MLPCRGIPVCVRDRVFLLGFTPKPLLNKLLANEAFSLKPSTSSGNKEQQL